MTRKTDPTPLQVCEECGGDSFSLVPVHRPDIPLHMEPIVNVDVEGLIVGYSGRLMCVYCNAILPGALDQVLLEGKFPHPSNPDWKPTASEWEAEGNVIQFPERS